MATETNKALLPAGLADDLPPHADHEAAVVDRLMATFHAYGYERVKPPLIEFEESLLDGPGAALAQQTFRVMDPQSQRMLGVRADMTVQVARIAATRLRDRERPLRLSYAGQVLRTRGSQLRPERQFAQAGFELIGSASLAADLEAIVLAVEALQGVGVERLSVDLTLPHLTAAIGGALDIEAGRLARIREALDRKDAAALESVAVVVADGETGGLFRQLLAAAGPVEQALKNLAALNLPGMAGAIVEGVADLVEMLAPHVNDVPMTLDPTEYHGFEYHTGVSFSVFARGVRGELGRGGRYVLDGGEPATGFSVYLDSLRRAVPQHDVGNLVFVPAEADLIASRQLHEDGWRTLRGLAAGVEPAAEARRLGCTHVLSGTNVVPFDGAPRKHDGTD